MSGSPFGHLNPFSQFGLAPVAPAGTSPAGAALPGSSATSGDNGAVPWHPDSGVFWLGLIAVATAVGIAGASVRVKAGPVRAGASAGKA